MPTGCHNQCPNEPHECGEYYFTPSPSLKPPIPETVLMHYFNYPQHCINSKDFNKMLPRRHTELKSGQSSAEEMFKVGWGLYFKEEICWFAVAGLPCALGITALLWFMIHLENDYKDASPPAIFTMAIAGMVLTLMKEIASYNSS
jgi:hypothetical protein